MAKSTCVCIETGGRRGSRSDSLTCVPTPSLAALPIRRLTLRDLPACADLSEDRGWPREEHKWGFLLTAGKGFGIDDPEGGLVAACVVTEYGSWDRLELAAVGMVLVAARHARQGVGRRLMRHVVSAMGTTPLTLHATPYGRPLYEELGFKVTGRAEMLTGLFTGEPESGVATRAATAEDLPAILRLDEEVFGADRTPLITRLPPSPTSCGSPRRTAGSSDTRPRGPTWTPMSSAR